MAHAEFFNQRLLYYWHITTKNKSDVGFRMYHTSKFDSVSRVVCFWIDFDVERQS